jgi:hypothetical protein
VFWFLFWAVASSIWCVTAATRLGATFDEPVYVERGLEHWRTGSHAGLMQLGTMPLPIDLDTLPLSLYERWHHITLDPDHDLKKLLPWARAGTLVFWWLLLGYGWLAARQVAGPWGGRLAVALLACEPSLLAHAGLATTDIALTACLLAFAYHFRVGREARWIRRVGVPSGWFAAVLLAKASGLVFGPLCMAVLEGERLLSKRLAGATTGTKQEGSSNFNLPIRRTTIDFLQILVLGLTGAFLYCGSDWRAEPSFVAWAHSLPDGLLGRVMAWTAEHARVFSNAGDGLVRQIRHNVRGHGTYLLGAVAQRALWYYFPIAITVKTTLPFLLLPLAIIALGARALWNWAFLVAAALLVFSVTCRVQIGIRLVLPVVAFGLVGLAAALALVMRNHGTALQSWIGTRRSYLAVLLACVSLAWNATAALQVWPDGLCYTNEIWGGTARGYLVLSDSNYDWGQGLKELTHWRESHGDAPLDIWYFGTDPGLQDLPAHAIYFHALPIRQAADTLEWVQGHYLAVSTTLLYGSVQTVLRPDSPERNAYQAAQAFLRAHRPSARTTTFLIYDFRNVKTQVASVK